MKKSEKPFFVDNLAANITDATAVVLVDFTGLGVKMQQDLKKRLKENGASMVVTKNTLFKIAAEKAKSPAEITSDTILTGPTALVITEDDPIAAIQVLHKFAKEFEIPQMKVGVIEGKFQDKSNLEILAKLPSKEILYTQTVGAIGAPLYGIVGVLQANMQKLVFILSEASSGQTK